jgi:hypothetical protein
MTELDLKHCADTTARPPAILLGADSPEDAKVIKAPDKILTLTAADAVEYGLAAGTARDADALSANLALKAWHVSDDRSAWRLMEDRARSARAQLDRAAEKAEYLRNAVPEVLSIDARLKQFSRRAATITSSLERLRKQFDAELRELDSERLVEVKRASIAANPSENIARINLDYRSRKETVAQRYLPQVRAYVEELKAIQAESERLVGRRNELVAGAE